MLRDFLLNKIKEDILNYEPNMNPPSKRELAYLSSFIENNIGLEFSVKEVLDVNNEVSHEEILIKKEYGEILTIMKYRRDEIISIIYSLEAMIDFDSPNYDFLDSLVRDCNDYLYNLEIDEDDYLNVNFNVFNEDGTLVTKTMRKEIDWYDENQFIFSVDDLINSYCEELYISMVMAFGEDKINEKDFFNKFTEGDSYSNLFKLTIEEKN